MTALRKSGACVAFTFAGDMTHPRDSEFSAALATRRFRTIENAASEEVSIGWVTPVDPTGDSFTAEDLDGGAGTWLRVRVDRKVMPKKWLQLHRDAMEKQRGKKLSARERRELKDDLTEKMLPRVLPTTAMVDALLFHERRLVLLLASSKSARESFGKLFFESFGTPLQRLDPLQSGLRSGLDEAARHQLERLDPMRWLNHQRRPRIPANPLAADDVKIVVRGEGNPLIDAVADRLEADGVTVERECIDFADKVKRRMDELGVPHRDVIVRGGTVSPDPEAHGFLGEEFLTWLWFRWEADGGEFSLPGGRIVGVALDDMLVFSAPSGDETQQTLRRGLPTRTVEARTSLRLGHRLCKARLLIAEGSRQWSVVVDAPTLALGSVRAPQDGDDCESDVDRTADRSANWLALHEIVHGLFTLFLRMRLRADYRETAGAEQAEWMAS